VLRINRHNPVLVVGVDLLRKSGEFPVSNEELDETATTVYEGI
jgi:hypothetical protein